MSFVYYALSLGRFLLLEKYAYYTGVEYTYFQSFLLVKICIFSKILLGCKENNINDYIKKILKKSWAKQNKVLTVKREGTLLKFSSAC